MAHHLPALVLPRKSAVGCLANGALHLLLNPRQQLKFPAPHRQIANKPNRRWGRQRLVSPNHRHQRRRKRTNPPASDRKSNSARAASIKTAPSGDSLISQRYRRMCTLANMMRMRWGRRWLKGLGSRCAMNNYDISITIINHFLVFLLHSVALCFSGWIMMEVWDRLRAWNLLFLNTKG